jgi:hypothetical protein
MRSLTARLASYLEWRGISHDFTRTGNSVYASPFSGRRITLVSRPFRVLHIWTSVELSAGMCSGPLALGILSNLSGKNGWHGTKHSSNYFGVGHAAYKTHRACTDPQRESSRSLWHLQLSCICQHHPPTEDDRSLAISHSPNAMPRSLPPAYLPMTRAKDPRIIAGYQQEM